MIEILGNPKYKSVYLSGPITGMSNGNKEEFERYEAKFKTLNFDVINPHKLFSEQEIKELNEQLENKKITQEDHWAAFMKKDIAHLVDCDIIAMLPNWEKSKGANIELRIAKDLFMPIIDATNLQEIF